MFQPRMMRFPARENDKERNEDESNHWQIDKNNLLAGIVVRMVENKVGKDDLDAFAAVTAELVIAVHKRAVSGRITGRRERAVLIDIAAEETITRRACRR